jgi:hypothetical protein
MLSMISIVSLVGMFVNSDSTSKANHFLVVLDIEFSACSRTVVVDEHHHFVNYRFEYFIEVFGEMSGLIGGLWVNLRQIVQYSIS